MGFETDIKTDNNEVQNIIDSVNEFEYVPIDDSDKLMQLEKIMVHRFCSLWAMKYKTIKGKPTTFTSAKSPFKHRPWQQGILDDNSPDKIVQKSRQLGISEVGLTESLFFLSINERTKLIYTFPRDTQVRDYSSTRVTPALNDSEYMKTLLAGDINNVALKRFANDSWLFLRSAWGSELGEGVDADCLMIDEYDRSREGVEYAFRESLKSSKYGLLRRWSTPTIPGRGINQLYDTSDQKRYVWKCEHCGEKQYLTFDENIIQVKDVNTIAKEVPDGAYIIGCKKCKRELNRWSTGEWVPFRENKDISGYLITQIDAVWISADDIMRRSFNYPSKQLFYNYVLGNSYANTGLTIVDSDILDSIRLSAPISSRTQSHDRIIAGIDWGGTNWMLILGMRDRTVDLLDLFWVEDDPAVPLKSANFFAAVLRAYTPDIIIADAGFGADRCSFLYTQYPHAFYSCHWVTVKDAQSKVSFFDSWNEGKHEVTVNKTVKVQRMLHQIKGRLIGISPMSEKIALLTKHLKNVRIMDEEDNGQMYQIATRVGDDHLACCLTYALIGVDKLTQMGTAGGGFAFEFI